MVSERAQFTTPRAVPAFVVGVAVAGLVGREVLRAWRDGLAACAPDCSVGAPLMTVGDIGVILLLVVMASIVVSVVSRIEPDEQEADGDA